MVQCAHAKEPSQPTRLPASALGQKEHTKLGPLEHEHSRALQRLEREHREALARAGREGDGSAEAVERLKREQGRERSTLEEVFRWERHFLDSRKTRSVCG